MVHRDRHQTDMYIIGPPTQVLFCSRRCSSFWVKSMRTPPPVKVLHRTLGKLLENLVLQKVLCQSGALSEG